MAARVTDRQKKKIIADYLETESYRAAAKKNGVCDATVKRIVMACSDFKQKDEEKEKAANANKVVKNKKKKSNKNKGYHPHYLKVNK